MVIEASGNAWRYYDLLVPLVGEVLVANPSKVKLITQSKVKTDASDAVALAKLLAADLVPTVWVPPQDIRELRALVGHRQRLVRQRTQEPGTPWCACTRCLILIIFSHPRETLSLKCIKLGGKS